MRVAVKVRPGSGRSAVEVLDDGSLLVWLKAAPENGRANAELVRVIARHFGVSGDAVRLVMGATSRRKVVEVALVEPSTP